MNLYLRKKRTKISLFALAILIVAGSLWYSDIIVKKIRKEERTKVRLWSKAIEQRAELVAYTSRLFDMLRLEEQKKVDHWLEATKALASPATQSNYSLIDKIISDNTTIPIIVVDDAGEVITYTNLDSTGEASSGYLQAELQKMKDRYPPLEINYIGDEVQYLYYRNSKVFRELQQVMNDLINSFISETVINSASVPVLFTDSTQTQVIASGNLERTLLADSLQLRETIRTMTQQNDPIKVTLDGARHYIFYQDSFLLTQLKFYPYLQLMAIGLFLLVSYLLFSTFRNAEQNQVWVGMAKETAHQLGTPLSSLMAWMAVLEQKQVEAPLLSELRSDVQRLETIADRFSKIGSVPELKSMPIEGSVYKAVSYLGPRIPKKVNIQNTLDARGQTLVRISPSLFEWVLENLIKNAVDAMAGKGNITLELSRSGSWVQLDIADSGKGIPRHQHKTVFEPGFTTKKRGWGLGLSLTKRIIENYHKGRIFVKHSEVGKGTTFRIALKLTN